MKGLAIIYDPHNLQQFLWYYCTYGKDVEWDALCLPNGYKGTYMDTYCKELNLFQHIYVGHDEYLNASLQKKIKVFFQMFRCYVTGKRETFCKDILNQYVGDCDRYDIIASICDTGMACGVTALLGKEKEVVFFHDSNRDLCPRKKWKALNMYKATTLNYWAGVISARMGYFGFGRVWLEPTKYCIKYTPHPEKQKYRNYKEIRKLYDWSKTDTELYNTLIHRIYPQLDEINFDDYEAVLFTEGPNEVSTISSATFIDACVRYIEQKHHSVIIKKHPRDSAHYMFGEGVRSLEVSSEVPGELILPYLSGKSVYFQYAGSLLDAIDGDAMYCHVFYYDSAYKSNSSKDPAYPSKHAFAEMLNPLIEKYSIIDI